MQFEPQVVPDVVLMTPRILGDERGFFMETFRHSAFVEHCGDFVFVQDNHSLSRRGTLRGLHYQHRHPQGKLVRVIRGEVYDVAVDMRQSSPTFGHWVGVYLSADNKQQLWIPPGFAHGFYVLSEEAEFVYKCSDYYAPGDEVSVQWNDPDLAIAWPLIDQQAPTLSIKDTYAVAFRQSPVF